MLVADRVAHTYANGTEALRSFSLSAGRGAFVSIVGPSGCGKSTLLRVLAGLVPPTGGSVTLDGDPIAAPSPRVSMMFQDAALLPWRSVERNVRLPLELGSAIAAPGANPPEARTRELIKLVGLSGFEGALPRELSGGMAQRAALARALIAQPEVLLLDEPFGALDAMTREVLTASLESIVSATRTTAVMVTHNITEAVFLSDQVLVCSPRPGRVIAAIPIDLPRPRAWSMERSAAFGEAVGAVREALQT